MSIIENVMNRYGIKILLLTLLAIGIYVVGDYNIASDEHVNRKNGGITANAVVNKINRTFNTNFFQNDSGFKEFDQDLNVYIDRDYGVAFDAPMFFLERLLAIDKPNHQYILRHGANFIIFLIGLYAFYQIAILRFANARTALLLTIMLVLTPRIFPDAFYNYKDILFLSLVVISVYTMLLAFRTSSHKNVILHGFTTALAIDTRIIGIMILFGTIGLVILFIFKKELSIRIASRFVLFYFLSAIFFIILFWPWLWINPLRFDLWSVPLDRFVEAFNNMSKFRWEGLILFRGAYVSANDLPWFYLPVWIFISTPLLYLLLMCAGVFCICRNLIRSGMKIWSSNQEQLDVVFLSLLVFPIGIIIIIKSVVYDGWRQVYFVYPWLVLISGVGFQRLCSYNEKLRLTLYFILIIYFINITVQMYKTHPYQMVYFNELISDKNAARYELDYWGMSTRQALQFIIDNDDRYQIKIYSIGNTTIEQTILMLDPKAKSIIALTQDPHDADYLIYNHRVTAFWNLPILEYARTQRELFYEVVSDRKILFTVFK